MARLVSSSALVLAGLAISGCLANGPSLTPHNNPSITSVHEPVVQRTDYVIDLATQGSGVPQTELGRLDAWFESLDLRYGDRISVDTGAGYSNPAAQQDVARVADAYGMLLSEGAPLTAGAVAPGSVRVVVSRSAATVPGCPLWNSSEIGGRLTTAPNYGCAVNSNLAAMIADPGDLVIGRSGDPSIDAATAAKAIRAYRSKAPTGAGELKQEATK